MARATGPGSRFSGLAGRTPRELTALGNVAGRIEAMFAPLFGGQLPVRLRAWDGSQAGPEHGPILVLRSANALRRLLWHPGELGLAQAYVTGELDVEGDLAQGLRRVWAAAREQADASGGRARPGVAELARLAPGLLRLAVQSGAAGPPLPPPDSQARLRGRLHSGRRDRAAIAHHYDLSNDFYALVLDENMAYSSAYWTSTAADYTLADAQTDKFDLVCGKLGIRPGDRLLDIGCGWGSLSIHAARHYGAQVTGITLSQQQARFARDRVQSLGLADQVEIRLLDYRDLNGPGFDAVVSLEMGEHVGEQNYPGYAATMHRMVLPGGRVLVQQMSRGANAPGGGAFIEAFIAPDMHMRPVGETVAFLERAGLEVRDVHSLREHYVRTVEAWHATFESRWDEAVAMVGEEVARVWRLYFVGGGLAFEEGRMGVDQILSVRPHAGGVSGMPAVRVG
jgi:cyclopropane-fatty-acyl-phospholipid synthase